MLPDLGERTLLMGILNVTPDSFSDGGRFRGTEAAVAHAIAMFEAGADIIDIGGESTRPGAEMVLEAVERDRIVPVIDALVERGIGPISVDTTKASVAESALRHGAVLVNDISGCTFDVRMRATVAEAGACVILMHTRDRPAAMQQGAWTYEGGVARAVTTRLGELVEHAIREGIPREAIAVDPGLGFGKTVEENVVLISELRLLGSLGLPILIGPSRKSFVGALTGRAVGERAFGTAAAVALAIANGASIVRVHDVGPMRDVARVADMISRPARPRACNPSSTCA